MVSDRNEYSMNMIFYGFQFPHHGMFSSFRAMSRALSSRGITVLNAFHLRVSPKIPYKFAEPFSRACYCLSELRLRRHLLKGGSVHYFYPENSLFSGQDWQTSGQLILTCHQPVERMKSAFAKGKLLHFANGLKHANKIILMASNELEQYKELAPKAEMCFVPHGIDTDYFRPGLHEGSSTFRVLTVGSWMRDYETWAKVVNAMTAKHSDIEFSVLASNAVLAPALSKITASSERLRCLHGISDAQLLEEYRRADVVFLPLIDAWANNVLIEAMACGCSIVATDLPAIHEYGSTSISYVERESAEQAVAELIRMKNDPACRQRMGALARKRALTHLSWKVVAERHLAVYQDG